VNGLRSQYAVERGPEQGVSRRFELVWHGGQKCKPTLAGKTTTRRGWGIHGFLFSAGFGYFFYCDWVEEGHAGAQLLADDFDGVFSFGIAEGLELFAAGVLVG
jgi:hypothetical protein